MMLYLLAQSSDETNTRPPSPTRIRNSMRTVVGPAYRGAQPCQSRGAALRTASMTGYSRFTGPFPSAVRGL